MIDVRIISVKTRNDRGSSLLFQGHARPQSSIEGDVSSRKRPHSNELGDRCLGELVDKRRAGTFDRLKYIITRMKDEHGPRHVASNGGGREEGIQRGFQPDEIPGTYDRLPIKCRRRRSRGEYRIANEPREPYVRGAMSPLEDRAEKVFNTGVDRLGGRLVDGTLGLSCPS